MEKYEPISYIGKGNFGSITKIRSKIDGKILVWKELNYGVMSEKDRNRIISEVNILRELHHPNIVKYYDRIIDKKNSKLYIVMEYCPGGDLSKIIKHNRKNNQYFSEDLIWKIFSQVASALYACHTHKDGKILHRDIKPSNIFIDQENNIKLGDFGLSRILNSDISFAVSRVGTPYYMSPEQIDNIKYNEKSDIWSLGCFLYELTTLHPPFEATTHLNLAKKIKSGKFENIPNMYSNNLCKVINMMMNIDQNLRPNIKEIISIPEISMRIKEKKIKDNIKKLKKMENELEMRENNLKEKEESLLIKEKYLNEREKNLIQREQYIKKKENEFIKFEKYREFNNNDLSITRSNFNIKCNKVKNNDININNDNENSYKNSFKISNSFSYKNMPMSREQKNKYFETKNISPTNANMNLNNQYMNHTDNYFYKRGADNNITNRINYNSAQKKQEMEYNTTYQSNNKNESTQNMSYNVNNRNDSTQNMSYKVSNKNDSTQNNSYNVNNNSENYIIYNPKLNLKNKHRYIGTSPNNKNKIPVYNKNPYFRKDEEEEMSLKKNIIYQSDYTAEKNYMINNENKNYNNNRQKQINYYRKAYNKNYSNDNEKINSYDEYENSNKYRKNDDYSKEQGMRTPNFYDNNLCLKKKQNIYNNNKIINFNNMNKNNSGHNYNNYEEFSKEKNYNNYYSERSTNINRNHSNNINVNKNIIYKNNRIADGQLNNYVPDSKKIMYQNYAKNLKHNGNSYNQYNDEFSENRGSEFQNNQNKLRKYNSFNQPTNSKINFVRINKSYNN